jgi:hypothetical protein
MSDEPKNEIVQRSTIGMGERGIQLRSIEDAYRFSTAVVKSNLAPASFKTPEAVMIAVQYGMELGMTPMKALQSIAVVNGRPTIWGDAALALVKNSGLLEYIKEEIIGDGDQMEARVESKRKNEPLPVVSTFSVAEAKQAGLWKKTGPWTQYPTRMLKYRARAFNLRDNFPDVMAGMHLGEEFDQIPEAAYESRTPTREQRRAIASNTVSSTPESQQAAGNSSSETNGGHADANTLKIMGRGCMNQFTDLATKGGFEQDEAKLFGAWKHLCSFLFGGNDEDYEKPETYTLEMLQTIQNELKNGIPEPVAADMGLTVKDGE